MKRKTGQILRSLDEQQKYKRILLCNAVLILKRSFFNRPFYSCVLSCLARNASEAGGDLVLIQTSLLFSCKCQPVSIRTI